ncbi:MAG: hypothetical protein VKP62_07460 [Candidatus Sericytochromatia bacterium]|nr:hypothetical protein [Candidatus Sericytochromatia bacterium]
MNPPPQPEPIIETRKPTVDAPHPEVMHKREVRREDDGRRVTFYEFEAPGDAGAPPPAAPAVDA